tara:strand:- start:597 stop:896 length:300 start_codon:yes stop_codon:yes gene_type:complete
MLTKFVFGRQHYETGEWSYLKEIDTGTMSTSELEVNAMLIFNKLPPTCTYKIKTWDSKEEALKEVHETIDTLKDFGIEKLIALLKDPEYYSIIPESEMQ